jgi:hypothetical protein
MVLAGGTLSQTISVLQKNQHSASIVIECLNFLTVVSSLELPEVVPLLL